MKLIIAEKPIAAKRIADILGKAKTVLKNGVECHYLPGAIVVPLKGHIVDLDFPSQYKSWSQTKLEDLANAQVLYVVSQLQIAKTLQELAPQAGELVIACDYDREGEAIGKEAINLIKAKNPRIKIKRAKFSTLEPSEVKAAFSKLVDFNYNLADAADSRREADLIWGAALTRFVSLASGKLGKEFLSVGRVQTPALALCVSREKEILSFKPQKFWVVSILCDKRGEKFQAVYEEEKIFDEQRAKELSALVFKNAKVTKVEKKQAFIKPPSPFDTTEFLRAASTLGFQPAIAMSLAEKLYMNGLTSYPRTDNTVYPASLDLKGLLSKLAKSKELGKHAKKILAQKKLEPSRGKKETTDHPPIYPVEVAEKPKLSAPEWKVYELIARRFLATLAPDSKIESARADLDYGGENFVARGKIILEKGWREYYPYLEIDETILPELEKGEIVAVEKLDCKQDATKPKPRYTPATLIKLMQQFNLGTKSTRAEILQKLLDRGYLQGKKNFTPSQIAFAVISALEKHAADITNPKMTADLEREMDLVEQGKKQKDEVVGESRRMLSKVVRDLNKDKQEISSELRGALESESVLGKCSSCSGMLRIISTPWHTRFVGCSYYSKGCRVSFPLPAKGKIKILGRLCKDCGLPVISVDRGWKKKFEMCINNKCKSKEGWAKKKETPVQSKPKVSVK